MNLSAENIGKIRELVRSGYPLKARDAKDLLGHNDHLVELLEARGRLMLAVEIERDQLKAENEALRKDADKWQIVERAMTQLQSDEQGAAIWSACSRILISVAGKLNSAHSTVTEEGVTFEGEEVGDWRVTVERIAAAMGKGEQS
ncbi:hypothetical protein [Pseudomonas tolaasii]|uniref:hypothetical protein n=1 Tax=Pseudomonas tolaasii TaxID=29442 RepID=UPI0015A17B1C|nr:hypothetical protein [Pseudomonas tolaasii]NWC26911.1 hypothetical protein [Pseudomonas tolaasii]NWE66614.1 hypothetical protein [Pseudomonas tolaasii]